MADERSVQRLFVIVEQSQVLAGALCVHWRAARVAHVIVIFIVAWRSSVAWRALHGDGGVVRLSKER